jgi:hypothetical protein
LLFLIATVMGRGEAFVVDWIQPGADQADYLSRSDLDYQLPGHAEALCFPVQLVNHPQNLFDRWLFSV